MSDRVPLEGPIRALGRHVSVDSERVLVGVEHEYSVWSGDRWLDARTLFDADPPAGARMHPVERRRYLTSSGITLHADDHVAEVASPPVAVGVGFTKRLDAWARVGRDQLTDELGPGLELRGESSHISVSFDTELAERAALLYAQIFAPALMLLMDRETSPGLLVRPRPGRLEMCGEYVAGDPLRAAALFIHGSALACREAVASGDISSLPPALQLTLEPGRLRFGWYVDRRAFGPDLYKELRAAELQTIAGGSMSAGHHLELAVEAALAAAASDASREERELLEKIAGGDMPLHAEGEGNIPSVGDPEPGPSVYAELLRPRERAGIVVEAVAGTWDFTAFRLSRNGDAAILSIPGRALEGFVTALDGGRLDRTLPQLVTEANGATLRTFEQTSELALFGDIEIGASLLPRDFMGAGDGPIQAVASGAALLTPITAAPAPSMLATSQVSIAEGTAQSTKGTEPVGAKRSACLPWWANAVLIAIPLVTGVTTAIAVGGDAQPVTTPPAVEESRSPIDTPTSEPATSPQDVLRSLVELEFSDPDVAELLMPSGDTLVDDFSGNEIPPDQVWYEEAIPESVVAVNVSFHSRDIRRAIDCGNRSTYCTDQWKGAVRGGVFHGVALGWASSGPLIRNSPDESWFFNFNIDTPAGNAPRSELGFAGGDCYLFLTPTQGDFLADRWDRRSNGPVPAPGPAAAIVGNQGILVVLSSNHPCANAQEMSFATAAFDSSQDPTVLHIQSPSRGSHDVGERPQVFDPAAVGSGTTTSDPTPEATPSPTAVPSAPGGDEPVTQETGSSWWLLAIPGLLLSALGGWMIASDCRKKATFVR